MIKNSLYNHIFENKNELIELFVEDISLLKKITSGNSKTKLCFKCLNYDECNNIYNVRARDITRNDGKNHKGFCKKCVRKKQGISYQKIMLEKNGNLTDKYPNIINIWSDKNTFTPEKLTTQSHKKIYLKCPNKKHSDYSIYIYNIKNNQFLLCPKCNPHFSKCEVMIFTEFKKLDFKVLHLSKIYKKEADLLLPELKLIIEVDGYPWHLNKEEKDLNKNKLFENLGYNVLRIRDKKLNNIDCNKVICDVSNFKTSDFNKILEFVNSNYNKKIKNINDFDVKLYQENYYKSLHIKYEQSVEFIFLESKNIWNYKKNIITPDIVKPNSSDKVWIKCINGHERYKKICDIFTKSGITKCKKCLEFTINKKNYSSMTDCCNKLNISRTNLSRKMKSQGLSIKNINELKNFIETNYKEKI